MDPESQRKSLDQFFRKEYQKLLSFVKKNMENRFFNASPEDIIQDVALSLLSKLNVESQIDNLTGYIYRSLKNKIIDSKRKVNNNVSIENFRNLNDENTLLRSLSEEQDSEETIMEPAAMYEAIETLRPDEQMILIATELEGRTFDDLSREWEVPIGTLLSRKHRALSKLSTILKEKARDLD